MRAYDILSQTLKAGWPDGHKGWKRYTGALNTSLRDHGASASARYRGADLPTSPNISSSLYMCRPEVIECALL